MWLDGLDCSDDSRYRVSIKCKTGIYVVQYANMSCSISCRLPQTPRTPSTGMAHYFDDVFTRHVGPQKHNKPAMRRSSTARSMGARSDFDSSVNGDHDHDDARSIGNSVEHESPDRIRARNEADAHIANYVSEQLERVRSHESFTNDDEFEAQLDES